MRLGNDTVDLEAAKGQHPRFAARILSAQEWAHFESAGSPDVLLWSYWAAKEAAYKAYTQTQKINFSPLLWEVNPGFDYVRFGSETLPLRIKRSEDMILAEVCDRPWSEVATAEGVFWREPSPGEQKEEARRLALALAEAELGEKLSGLKITKVLGMPQIHSDSRRWVLSLSHHGRFVAASLLLNPLPLENFGTQ